MNEIEPTTKKPLILIDGSSYLFRAYYALPPLSNSKGKPTGAIYGVINMLRKLIADYQPDYIAVIFDPKGKTFRDDLYASYKANRKVMPNDLQEQIQPLFSVIKALGLPLLIKEGFEADDVIATLAAIAKKQGMKIIISTGDKDLAQIVDEDITLINTMTDRVMDITGVKEKFGVPAERMVDYLTLVGDSTDNVPGIPSVGPKTAAKWLQTYGSLENIINQASSISGKVGEHLRANLKNIPLTRELVTVKKDVLLDIMPKDLRRGEPQQEILIELFTDLEFKSWLNELLSIRTEQAEKKVNYTTIFTQKEFYHWLTRLQQASQFAFDTETTDLDAMRAKLVGVSFSLTPYEAVYIPLRHDYLGAPQQLNVMWVCQQLKTLLEDPQKTIIGQNLKYDIQVLAHEGIIVKNKCYDTLLESYVLNSSSTRHDLNTLALKYLGRSTILFEDIAGKGTKQLKFNQISVEKAAQYAAEDADVVLQLHQKMFPLIEADSVLKNVFHQIEMPLMPVLTKMEMVGVLIDADMLNKQSQELQKRMVALEQEAYRLSGREFNLNSPKQLQQIFFDELKIPILKKTPGGQASTAENVLQDLAFHHELPKIILEHRQLSKLKSTYTDRLPEQMHPITKRIHTSYNQAITSTGRLSSNNPNLQNIPIRTEAGRKIRQAFIARPGYRIIAADYSQVELRIIAHISQDLGLIKAFTQELDIHRATAAEVFGIPLKQVSDEQRRRAKAINFGLLYGMSSFGLSRQLGIDRDTAQKYMDIYFQRYPKVHEYMQKIREVAAAQGYVETFFGRRVYLPDIRAGNLQRRRAAERAAINAPMQGTAADIVKIAMIKIDQWLQTHPVDAHMIMQVHDELIFEVAEKDIDQVIHAVGEIMQQAAQLSVSLLVDIGVGRNWDEAH